MTTDRYALVDDGGVVINVIRWDGETQYRPKVGKVCGPVAPGVEVGDTLDADGTLIAKYEPPFDEELAAALRELDGAP